MEVIGGEISTILMTTTNNIKLVMTDTYDGRQLIHIHFILKLQTAVWDNNKIKKHLSGKLAKASFI